MGEVYLSTIDPNAHILAGEYGLGIEIAEFCTPWNLDTDFEKIDPIVREKMAYSSRFVLHGPFSELFPSAVDPKIRAVAAERFGQTLQIAANYGIGKVVLHGGYNPRLFYPVWYQEQSVLFWKEFEKTIPGGMTVCLENVLEEEPGLLAQIVRQVDSPKIRMCMDAGHVNAYSPVSVFAWLIECADVAEHFHIHNNHAQRDEHAPLMQGTIPMQELLTAIREKCPRATCTLELTDGESSVRWLKDHDYI